ncbi:hypothetical protein FKM82_009008 [Ascaphus truei]
MTQLRHKLCMGGRGVSVLLTPVVPKCRCRLNALQEITDKDDLTQLKPFLIYICQGVILNSHFAPNARLTSPPGAWAVYVRPSKPPTTSLWLKKFWLLMLA